MNDQSEVLDFAADSSVFSKWFGPNADLANFLLQRGTWSPEQLESWVAQLSTFDPAICRNALPAESSEWMARVRGLIAVLRTALLIRESPEKAFGEQRQQLVTLLTEAVAAFSEAWKLEPPPCVPDVASNIGQPPTLHRLFQAAGWRRDHVATAAVWSLLEWGNLVAPAGAVQPDMVTVSTPLLAARETDAIVMQLTVDLIPRRDDGLSGDRGVLIPDLRFLGLTGIGSAAAADESFHRAFLDIWEVSGFGRWMDGVWRLENTNPAGLRLPCHTPQLRGPSAQAGLLCCLLSALQNPEQYQPDDAKKPVWTPERLSETVAISAAVDVSARRYGDPLSKLPLKSVGKVPEKAFGAYQCGLKSAVFRKDTDFEKGSKWQRAMQDQEAKPFEILPGLWIEKESQIIEDVLNIALERNQYLRVYQSWVAKSWNDQWLNPEESVTDSPS
jgi:hypothetical protein